VVVEEIDASFMRKALALAERGRGTTSPNPLVGALVVDRDGVIVGRGAHRVAGGPHAEVIALEDAGPRARGATLYCTLEPCSHVGRTGPCVARIVDAGIARVVASVEDPNPLVSGKGFAFLRAHGIEVETGPRAAEAIQLNQPFFTRMRHGRPFVIVKAAVSLDGGIAEAPGQRTQLTSSAANRHAQRVRAEVDAIAVGAGTILGDDPLLTVREAFRPRPLVRVILDRQLRTPPAARVLSTGEAGPVIIVTSAEAGGSRERRMPLEARGAEIEVVPDGSLRSALECLGRREINSVLLEGGAVVHKAAFEEDLVDYLRLYVTPHVLGPAALRFAEGRRVSTTDLWARRVEPLGPDVVIEGYVHRPH
jgi:diaminohydroxyphosphoribosylaminopyrimidine deaminase/5-amino-6-(5-phosphoribosylamino)uracil reductase